MFTVSLDDLLQMDQLLKHEDLLESLLDRSYDMQVEHLLGSV